jgi:hypothetical protein
MSSLFQIVFKGELLDGFDLAVVKASAARRLKAAPEQIDRVFSGTRAILKKGLDEELSQRYLSELERIGMRVFVEPEIVKAPRPELPAAAEPIVPAAASSSPRLVVPRNEPQRVTSRDQPAFDPLKTQIASMQDDVSSPQRWSQPTIAISQRHLNELTNKAPSADAVSSVEPTMIVPPRTSAASEPTIVVTRTSAASQPTMVVPPRGGSSDMTMIVPPRHSAASEPTMVVPPRHSAASEPTMIVPPRSNSAASEPTMIVPSRGGSSDMTMIVPPRQSAHAASSEPTMIVPPKHAHSSDATIFVPPRQSGASHPTIIVRSNQTLPPTTKPGKAADAPYDPEKTLIAASQDIDDYLSPASDEELARALPPVPPLPEAVAMPEVQCPTCGDKQPKRVYCRRCGHALSLPPKPAVSETSPPKNVLPPLHDAGAETVLFDEQQATAETSAAKSPLAWRAWFAIGLVFVLLLAVAGWLFM